MTRRTTKKTAEKPAVKKSDAPTAHADRPGYGVTGKFPTPKDAN
jgi:hypothetical protein